MKYETQFDIQLNTKSAKYNFIGLVVMQAYSKNH